MGGVTTHIYRSIVFLGKQSHSEVLAIVVLTDVYQAEAKRLEEARLAAEAVEAGPVGSRSSRALRGEVVWILDSMGKDWIGIKEP